MDPAAPLSLRLGVPADTDVLVRFNAAMASETEDKGLDLARLECGVRSLLAHPERGFYLVAERHAELVGQLLVTFEWSDWRDANFWWIQSVYVEEAHRRAGVYSALHRDVEGRAREAGACGLRLYVERENAIAKATYRALGMERTRYDLFEVEWRR